MTADTPGEAPADPQATMNSMLAQASTPDAPLPSPWAAAVITAVSYVLLGATSALLSAPPAHVCPVYPAAGLALAAVLAWGRAALIGVFLGALLLGLGAQAVGVNLVGSSTALHGLIGLGAALQAWLGASLIRRHATQPLVLNKPRDIAAAGLLGGLVASFTSASLGTAALWLAGTVSESAAPGTWLSWWLADSTGILLFAPVVLSFIARPAADWRARRRTVAPPMLLALALLVAGTLSFEHLQAQRVSALFERDANRLEAAARQRLGAPVLALRALQGASAPWEHQQPEWLQQASRWWLTQPIGVETMGVARRVALADLAKYEAGASLLHRRELKVFDTDGGAARLRDQEVLAVHTLQSLPAESAPASAALVGLNLLSQPEVRLAVRATRGSAEPASTTGFRQPAAAGAAQAPRPSATKADFLIVQALYDGPATDQASRQQHFSGVAFVSVDAQQALKDLQERDLAYLHWCLSEAEAAAVGGGRRWLAGTDDCGHSAAHLLDLSSHATSQTLVRALKVADRDLVLHISARPDQLPGVNSRSRWVVPVVGLLCSVLLGTLLLTITGYSRRIEQVVLERTTELRREMSERSLVQEALRASEEHLRVMVDNLPLGIALLDASGRLLECNPRLCGMLGQSTENLRGLPVTSCFEPGESPLLHRMRKALIQQRRTVDSVDSMKLRAANGRLTDVRVVASALHDGKGNTPHMVAVIEDMTAHHQLQDSELALSRAEGASRAKSEFVSRMSHELRTPLNAMIGFAQLLALADHPSLPPRQLMWAQQIQRAGWHLLAMINDTLDLARIESGATRLSLEAVHLPPLLQACRDWVEAAALQRKVSLQLSIEPDLPPALADATRLKQVLTNLLSNAVKYNREGGAVHIQARRLADQQLEISVSDTGLGMSAEQVAALFQPYNRLGRESSGVEGSGIGLVISRRLAELMRGTLHVQSADGKGSTFTLTLPSTDAPHPPPASPLQPGPARYQQRLVHYVEDNSTNVEVMRGVLALRRQITLQTSTLGLDGLSAIRHSRPDLILLDMQLPDISGLELLRHILNDDQISSIPVIVVSADATPQNMERALTLGAKHYVTKPLDIAAFLAMVDQTLSGGDAMT